MTHPNPQTHTPPGEVPGEVPSEVPAGTSVARRAGEVPGSLSYGGTSLAQPLSTDPTHEVPSEVPTTTCGQTWRTLTCTIRGPHRVLPDGRTCHTFVRTTT